MFPHGSSPGDTLCITFSLINDTLFESNEDFVVELNTGDPSVMISEDANIAVITIRDVPYSLCKDFDHLLMCFMIILFFTHIHSCCSFICIEGLQ